MILPDHEIEKAVKNGQIVIRPLDPEEQIKSVGVDLKLGNEFRLFRLNHKSHINPAEDSFDELTEIVRVKDGGDFILHPGEFVLGVTKEHIELPADIMARIDGRSSLGRMGIIVHSTAGRVDPGFKGTLTLEITNIGKLPVNLFPGMRFCSLVFERLGSPVKRDYGKIGKYVGQKGPVGSRISQEFKKI